MFGLCDIPCVSVFVERVSEYTVAAVFRGLKYMFCYKALVEQLNSETTKLNIEKDNMSRKVKEEKANGKEILGHVLDWQNDVERIHGSVEELSPSCSCFQRLPIPNPVSRFRLGRNVANKAKTVAELIDSGKNYLTGEIAHLPPFQKKPNSNTVFEEFESRKYVYKTIWDALVNEDSPLICGIYGMAGVGKTQMMEKIWDEAMEKKKFNTVVRVNVGSEHFEQVNLQDQVAVCLNCRLESKDMEHRAFQLENSLKNGGKILLILDDVWRDICLDKIIGTPFGSSSSKGSKILLTSREKEVCLLNKCERVFEIKSLSPDEALYLFKKAVGSDTISSLQDDTLVQGVCDECGKLPLLIHAVGKALERKHHVWWKDAHKQLKMGNIGKIAGENPYACIKLSIDHLKDDDAKLCLFFCCMFPEDANIDMKMLIQLASGSRLIPDGESRIPVMVDYLKTSSLLLGSGENNATKVHDIIRDVARHMASRESEYAFLHKKCNSGLFPSDGSVCTGKFLRLDVEASDVKFKENLVCPDLHTLWLQCNSHPQRFSGGFFKMFSNLSLLILEKVNIYLEHFSLQHLVNLGTLILSGCDISKIDVSPFPENLETLCIRYSVLPRPLDVAKLKCLRKLEVQQYGKLVMVPNVISSLSSLEELHIPSGFISEPKEHQKEPIVVEISKLKNLKSLQFQFDDEYFQGRNVFSDLGGYDILVGKPLEYYHLEKVTLEELYSRDPSRRSIGLFGHHWQCWEGLMARAHEVRLGYSDFEMRLGHIRAFEVLKELYIQICNKMEHLASISHDEIQYTCPPPAIGFSNLTILKIKECSKLKYLFCNNIARSLGQLQELSVEDCESMEAIIMNEDGGTSDGDIIIFSKLKSLKLLWLPRLSSFYVEKRNMNLDSTLSMDPPLFDGTVAFPCLELLAIYDLRDINAIWGNECCNDTTLSSFCKLNYLRVGSCDKLEIIGVGEQAITDGILFPQLRFLQLDWLPSFTRFWGYESENANTSKVPLILPQLSSLVLHYMPHLKSFLYGVNFEFHTPALKKVDVLWCGISTLFTFSMFRKFQLEHLVVRACELLENIVEDLREDETCDKIIKLSQLTRVDLERLPKLKSFFHNANYEFHMPVIKQVIVRRCGLSGTLFTRSVFENLKQLEELIVCDCELLEGIFEDARGAETVDTSNNIITLDRVSEVHLQGLPKLKTIFYGATYDCYMSGLKDVKIVDCGISILFTCSVFRAMPQLKELHVSKCESLEHVVKEVGGDETSELNDKSISSSQLSSITLESLPNLKSFSCTSMSYVFSMPKLRDFTLVKCPRMEYFSSSKTSLVCVANWHIEEDYGFIKGEIQDLNDYIRQNYKEEAT